MSLPRVILVAALLLGSSVSDARSSVSDSTIESLRQQVDQRRYAALADTIGPFLDRARAEGDSLRLGQLICLQGQSALGIGEVDESLDLLDEARRIAIAQRDTLTWMTTLGVGALALGHQGRYDEIIALAERQIGLAHATANSVSEAFAQLSLGYAGLRAGQLDPARAAYRRAIELFAGDESRSWRLTAMVGRGRVESSAGELNAARRTFGRVLELARTIDDPRHQTDALNNLGAIENRYGRHELAARYNLAAYEVQSAAGLDRGRHSIVLGNLVGHYAIHLPAESIPELLSELHALRASAREAGALDDWTRATFSLAAHERSRGRLRAAGALYLEAIEVAPSLIDRQWAAIDYALTMIDEVPADSLLARTARVCGSIADSPPPLRGYLAAARVVLLNRLRRSSEALEVADEALSYAPDPKPRARLHTGRATALARTGLIDASLRALQTSVGIVDTLARRFEGPERGWTVVAVHQTHLVDAAAELVTAAATAGEDRSPEVFALLQRLKARTLLRELGYTVEGRLPARLTEAETRQRLGRAEVLVDFHLGARHAIVFGLRADRFQAHVLEASSRSVQEAAELLVERIAPDGFPPPTTAELRPGLRRLRRLLLEPIEELLEGVERVTIAPDGRIGGLPFVLLLGDETAEVDGIATPHVEFVPCVAFRDPDLVSAGDESVTTGPIVTVLGQGPEMPGSQREVREIERRFADVRASTGWSDHWESDMRGAGVVHVAAHAEVDSRRPWRSGFRLSPDPDAADDALLRPTHLRAADLMTARLDAGLAVLSACESGVGRFALGEGVIGLSSAFLMARCRSVVSTLWPVDDAVTADLMAHFYAKLGGGAPVSESLRFAQQAIRARPETAAPYYWAGFVVIGDGELQLALQQRASRGLWLALGAAILMTILISAAIIRGKQRHDGDPV